VFGKRRKQAEAENAQLRAQVDALTGDLDTAKRQVAEEVFGRTRLESALEQAQSQTAALQEQLVRAQGMDIAERALEVERLRAQISELECGREEHVRQREEDAARAEAALAEKAERATLALQAQLAAKQAESEQIAARVQAAEERLTQV
jgi:hypothetical protein